MSARAIPRWRFATLREDVIGKFTQWKAGSAVKALATGRKEFLIERVKWIAPHLPMMNQCAGVRRDCLALHGLVPADPKGAKR